VSRKCGTGEVGWYTQGKNNMAVSGFGYENPSVLPFLLF